MEAEQAVMLRVRAREENRIVMVVKVWRRGQGEGDRGEETNLSCEFTSRDRRNLSQEL